MSKPCTTNDKVSFTGFHHPADRTVDYNSAVDNLEDEHIKRTVCTTGNTEDDLQRDQQNIFGVSGSKRQKRQRLK